jgi:hypothetical protein
MIHRGAVHCYGVVGGGRKLHGAFLRFLLLRRALPSSGETKRARQVHMNITAHSGWLPLPHMKSLTAMLSLQLNICMESEHI